MNEKKTDNQNLNYSLKQVCSTSYALFCVLICVLCFMSFIITIYFMISLLNTFLLTYLFTYLLITYLLNTNLLIIYFTLTYFIFALHFTLTYLSKMLYVILITTVSEKLRMIAISIIFCRVMVTTSLHSALATRSSGVTVQLRTLCVNPLAHLICSHAALDVREIRDP